MLSWSSWALAEPSGYQLDYEADASCPDAATFSRLVEAQLQQFDSPSTTLAGWRARVELRALAQGAKARLELKRLDGTSYERELHDRSCEEVAPALAFVLAYALGGQERSGPPSTPSPEASPATENAESSRAERANASAARAPGTDSNSPPRPQRRPRWQLGLGVELGARTGLAPTWTLVEGANVELRPASSAFPRFHWRASLLRGEPVTRRYPVGEAQFSWLAGRLDLCPLQLSPTTTWSLLPCLGSHVGRFQVVGRPSEQLEASGRTAQELWVDAVVSLRAELLLWNVLSLQARGELLSALTPYRFAFDNPDTAVYLTPRVASAAFVGVGALFP